MLPKGKRKRPDGGEGSGNAEIPNLKEAEGKCGANRSVFPRPKKEKCGASRSIFSRPKKEKCGAGRSIFPRTKVPKVSGG